MPTFLRLFLLAILASLSYSCNFINPSENIPVYLKIDSFTLNATNKLAHGEVTKKITDAWVYYDNNLIGTFPLPATVPIINNGDGQVSVLGGIYENGISNTRALYKLYKPDFFTLNKNETGSVSRNPIITYQDSIKLNLNGDFENGPVFVKRNGDTTIFQNDAVGEVRNGIYSGKIYLDTAHKYAECVTPEFYNISKTFPTYLELDYKNTVPFTIKALYYSNTVFNISEVATVSAKSDWNKIYINLSSFAIGYNTESIKLIVESSLPTGTDQANIILDNLKIIAIK